MPRVYEKIKEYLPTPKIIHIIGTNGKGTTGRFLANALYSIGFNTGHYTSPHILEFNERIYLNDKNVTDTALEVAHIELQALLDADDAASLSYFEYTTLLGMIIFKECDYVVMEAGLGGEHDATAVFLKTLTLVTPIAYDHEAFLGSSIEQIAKTKLMAIQNNAILATQKYNEVYEMSQTLVSERALKIYKVDELLNQSDIENIEKIAKNLSLVAYLKENLSLSIAALNFLKIVYTQSNFSSKPLFGRVSRISKNIVVDVGHNALAASRVAEALSGEKFTLVYNSYKDKNYKEILFILKPLIWEVEIIEVENQRVEDIAKIKKALDDLDIKHTIFKEIKEDKNYLVFGSFSVVEKFLKGYIDVSKQTV
jgi:dihydrofolate synthase/folylpolyglutamate synthase